MRFFLLTGLVCLVAGCSGEQLGGVSITGKVSFADGSPLKKGVVSITGDNGSSRGAIKEDGTFTLNNVKNGDYQVAITGAQEGGAAAGGDDMQYDEKGNYVESKPAEAPKPLIAAKYGNPETSGLSLKVPSNAYTLEVEKP